MKKNIVLILSVIALLSWSSSAFAVVKKLTILHFNDLHGYIASTDGVGGLAKIAAIVRQVKEENKKGGAATIVLFGGDIFSGPVVSRAFKGAAEMDLLNQIGIDAAVIGNHEFDYGLPVLKERMMESKFPMLSANMLPVGEAGFDAQRTMVVTTANGIKAGIIGLTMEGMNEYARAKDLKGFRFESPDKAVRREWKKLERSSDIQIALTHQGVEADAKFAASFPKFEMVIGGHDHVGPARYCQKTGELLACETPAYGKYVGRVDMEVDGRKAKVVEARLIPVDAKVQPDEKLARIASGYTKEAEKEVQVVIGRAKEALTHERGCETPLGDFLTDVTREDTEAEIAILNSGPIRRPMNKGKITKKDMFEIFPFDNELVTMKMKGADVQVLLDRSASNRAKGGFLQVSGLKFEIKDGRAIDVTVEGQPLEPGRTYTVATTDFVAYGGDGYDFPGSSDNMVKTGRLLRDAAIEHIKKARVVNPPQTGRIIIVD